MNSPPAAAGPRADGAADLKSMTAVVLLGFSSGFPLLLTADTLALWLTDHGMKLGEIGAFGLVALPYTFKFVWAPLLDAITPPFLDRRRGWIVIAQVMTALAMFGMSLTDPGSGLMPLAIAATCVAFASATQDIAIDAWRSESFDDRSAAGAASVHVTGYRVAMLASGAGALLLHGPLGLSWGQVYAACAGIMLLGIVGVLLAPRPLREVPAPSVEAAVVRPFAEILSRPAAFALLGFIVLFKLPDVLAGAMTMPFLRQTGFGDAEIAAVRQGLGVFVTIAGVLVGGLVAARVGLRKALLVYGILQAVSNLAFCGLALAGASTTALTATVVVENFCGGLVTAGFLGFIQRQCSPGLAATQFALLTSLMALPRTLLGGPAGVMAEKLGWPGFFAATAALGLPGLLLLPWIERKTRTTDFDAPAPVPSDAVSG